MKPFNLEAAKQGDVVIINMKIDNVEKSHKAYYRFTTQRQGFHCNVFEIENDNWNWIIILSDTGIANSLSYDIEVVSVEMESKKVKYYMASWPSTYEIDGREAIRPLKNKEKLECYIDKYGVRSTPGLQYHEIEIEE